MAILHCRHCGSEIDSDARRSQCRECRALFPFQCATCKRKLRPPFPLFEDERHLTLEEPPQPLCEEHFLRKCPDCEKWFPNDENPGYFRCLECAEKSQSSLIRPEWSDAPPKNEAYPDTEMAHTAPLVVGGSAGVDSNIMVLGAAGCAFLALIGWFLMGR